LSRECHQQHGGTDGVPAKPPPPAPVAWGGHMSSARMTKRIFRCMADHCTPESQPGVSSSCALAHRLLQDIQADWPLTACLRQQQDRPLARGMSLDWVALLRTKTLLTSCSQRRRHGSKRKWSLRARYCNRHTT
jgi:hypothetical protein